MEISVARLSWGIENDLTQRVSLRDPVAVTRITLTSQRLDLVHWDRAIAVFESGSIGECDGDTGLRRSALPLEYVLGHRHGPQSGFPPPLRTRFLIVSDVTRPTWTNATLWSKPCRRASGKGSLFSRCLAEK